MYNPGSYNFTCGFGCLCKEPPLKRGLNEMEFRKRKDRIDFLGRALRFASCLGSLCSVEMTKRDSNDG